MIINMTQHLATEDQVTAGVVNLPDEDRRQLVDLLTFLERPTQQDLQYRADTLAQLASDVLAQLSRDTYDQAMVGGAPYLMAPLERALLRKGIFPVYAFSVRESSDQIQADGSVRKVSTFRHAGWVEACTW